MSEIDLPMCMIAWHLLLVSISCFFVTQSVYILFLSLCLYFVAVLDNSEYIRTGIS